MRRAFECLRVILVSPEIAVALLVLLLAIRYPETLVALSRLLRSPQLDASTLVLLGIPSSLVIGTYSLGIRVLRPGAGRNVLIQWPDYWQLRVRVFVAFGYAVAGLVGWIAGWYCVQLEMPIFGVALALGSVLVAAISFASVAIARIMVREVLDGQ